MARFKENAGEVNPARVMCSVGRQHDSDTNLPDLAFGAAGFCFLNFSIVFIHSFVCVGGHMQNLEDVLWE